MDLEYTWEEPPTDLLNLPWVDVHNHAHTLSWEDREQYALSGCEAMVMVAAGYHWTPYNPVQSDDIRFLWDDAINRRVAIQSNHAFRAKLAIGIHTGTRVEDPGVLLDALDRYCELDEVIAIGETGVTPSQHARAWDLEEQRAVVEGQCERAAAYELPVILHTPMSGPGPRVAQRPGTGVPGYEKNVQLDTEPVIDAEDPALRALETDIAAARDAGLPEERIVASHAGRGTLEYIMEETDCYASFTLGHQWLLGVTVEDVADAISKYGPDRIMLDTDCANVLRTDPLALKRAIPHLYRLGIDREAIGTIVYDNPQGVFELGG